MLLREPAIFEQHFTTVAKPKRIVRVAQHDGANFDATSFTLDECTLVCLDSASAERFFAERYANADAFYGVTTAE